jgi:hypothetical protein
VHKKLWIVIGLAGLSAAAYAKEPKPYQTGTLLKMDAVHCGVAEKDSTSLAGQLLGNDSGNKKSEEVLCQEYVLQSDTLVYRVRPHDEKHPPLLPVGAHAQFRIEKDKMLLRVEDMDNKEREFSVVSMAPRTDNTAANAAAVDPDRRLKPTPAQ